MPKHYGTVIEQAARVLVERVGRTTITDADRSLVRDMLDAAGLLHTDPAPAAKPQSDVYRYAAASLGEDYSRGYRDGFRNASVLAEPAAFLAHHRSPAAPGCDCHLTVRQVCDTCQGVTGEEKDVKPAAARVPQPGDRVRQRAHHDRAGTVSGDHDDQPGRVRVRWDANPQVKASVRVEAVEVIEPAPATEGKPEFADRLAEASRAAAEATFGERPADTGKETDRG